MRKIFTFDMVSIDGYFSGPNGELDWHNVDAEFNEFALQQLGEIGTLLFGHTTFDFMAEYWPTEGARTDDPTVAKYMNDMPKVVVSTHDLGALAWENSTLISSSTSDVLAEIAKLKAQPGKDIAIFGSSKLSVSLLDAGLVDEVRIMVNPVALGSGRPLFAGLANPLKLARQSTQEFASGNVALTYLV